MALQIDIKTYASDALEDAMRLAQTKALNSYTWSDMFNSLNQIWMDVFQQLILHDDGFYSKTVQLTEKLTHLPKVMKNSIRVYAAPSPVGYNREVFRASGAADLVSHSTYHISGWDLWCPDVARRRVWLNYVPQQPQLFFTMRNRDPKLYDEFEVEELDDFNMHTLERPEEGAEEPEYWLRYRRPASSEYDVNITDWIMRDDWDIEYISCRYPYIFMTYKHIYTEERYSGFWKNILGEAEWVEYNPFAFIGKNSNVQYLKTDWNDKTGMGVIVKDWNDMYERVTYDETSTEIKESVPRIKELGWTPDSEIVYPDPSVYRLIVVKLAEKLAAYNESKVAAIQDELTAATFAFNAFINKDKSAWARITNVNTPNIMDYIV